MTKSESVDVEINKFIRGLQKRNPYETEFQQAVEEVVSDVMPLYIDNTKWRQNQILERLCEADRIITFRVTWQTDSGELRVNRGWRVQFNNSIGPYKGGLRFHPSVNQSILKFLGFEQVLKNSLTGLPMGGAKGGSNFDPKGKSDAEIMRFCQSFMAELHRHIGEDTDVPAGDIGVGSREIGYLFGQYKRLENRWAGVMTGKACDFGGSAVRKEATGYGCVYFSLEMLKRLGRDPKGLSICISGSGNVALYAAEKALDQGMRVRSLSDSEGTLYFKSGLNKEDLKKIKQLKEVDRKRLADFDRKSSNANYLEDEKPWGIECDIAIPCATQNEISLEDAKDLVKNGVKLICEGANMPCTAEATQFFRSKSISHAPGKASNAGGVAVSGLEQAQNSMRLSWTAEKVDSELKRIMKEIHKSCLHDEAQKLSKTNSSDDGYHDYVAGANIASFVKMADVMSSYGAI